MTNHESCPRCRRPYVISGRIIPAFPLYEEANCPACGQTLGMFRNDIGKLRVLPDRSALTHQTA